LYRGERENAGKGGEKAIDERFDVAGVCVQEGERERERERKRGREGEREQKTLN
jgi:hypothetical protein